MTIIELLIDLIGEGFGEAILHCTGRFILWSTTFGLIRYEGANRIESGRLFYRKHDRTFVTAQGATIIGLLALLGLILPVLVTILI